MIGIISDTHEQEESIKEAVKVFKRKKVDIVVHCGDVICPSMLDLFKGLKLICVFGNCDGEKYGLNDCAKRNGFLEIKDTQEFEHANKMFFVCHGNDRRILEGAINSKKFDYIFTGHTHILRDEKIGKTRVINPGATFRVSQKTIALLDPATDSMQIIKL